ncbi:MAG: hypothetical protein IJZ87_09040 [Bacteroidales bacterium]|nr:hypothetical protein [Bacteroidales bacterium]
MYDERIEQLINAALADGVLTEKEKQILFKRAQEQGIDLDEFEMVLDARLVELQKAEKEKAEKSAPKSDKYGSVRKCPACSAIVGAFKGSCPECGYEFSNVDANLSSKKLYDALAKEMSSQKKKEIIETFPLPNTKADLLEFLTALKPRIVDLNSEFADSYYKKYAECIEKAKVSFLGDKQLQPFIDDFNIVRKEIKRKKISYSLKKRWKLVAIVLVLVAIGMAATISSIKENIAAAQLERQKQTFAMHISDGDAECAKSVLKEMGIYFYDEALDLIKLYISNGDVNNAIDVYEKLTPKHCSMFDIEYSHLRHGSNKQYEPEATNLIRKELIKLGDYDMAWYYSEKKHPFYDPNDFMHAGHYYRFMAEVVNYLCENNKKQEARKFVNRYIQWFSDNVDVISKSCESYENYNSQKSKTKLLNIINNY